MLGIKNLSIAGRGGSSAWWDKMWASYVQLNPGVYSDAIATEFKRRLQPDYVENFVPNGGGLNATDWEGAVGGAAQGFIFANVTPTIVTGNGFTGNAQRIVATTTVASFSKSIPIETGKTYNISFKYRASAGISLRLGSYTTYPTNTGDAILVSFTSTVGATLVFGIYPRTPGGSVVGDWVEVDELTISPAISVNYFNTFGPSGLNKTTADWIGIMVTSSETTAKTNTKIGATLKWNCDGTIITQNNLPAYTKGANAGIITFTSTDGFSGITIFDCSASTLTHLSGLYGFTNLARLYVNNNQLTSITTYKWTNLAYLYCNSNQLTSLTTYAWTNLGYLYCNNNQLTSLTNFGTNKISVDSELGNYYTTTMVNSRLAYYNTMFAATPPIKNFTLNLSGATMGIPTGGANNADYLGIIAKVQAAGFIPSVIIQTT